MDSLLGRTVVIDLADDPLPDGRSHSMTIKIWTRPDTPVADLPLSAQVLALGFLERAVATLRKEVMPIAEESYWRPAYEEARVMETAPRRKVGA